VEEAVSTRLRLTVLGMQDFAKVLKALLGHQTADKRWKEVCRAFRPRMENKG
jgi:hypothetical protein